MGRGVGTALSVSAFVQIKNSRVRRIDRYG